MPVSSFSKEAMPPIGWFIMHANYEGVEKLLYNKADPNPIFHAMNQTHDRTGEWFTPLDLLDWITDHDHFEHGFSQPDVMEELPELHEKYIHMRDRLRVNGGRSFTYLNQDEL